MTDKVVKDAFTFQSIPNYLHAKKQLSTKRKGTCDHKILLINFRPDLSEGENLGLVRQKFFEQETELCGFVLVGAFE